MKEYNGWLVSPNMLKRSVAVVGHYMLGIFIIYFIIGLPLAILVALLG